MLIKYHFQHTVFSRDFLISKHNFKRGIHQFPLKLAHMVGAPPQRLPRHLACILFFLQWNDSTGFGSELTQLLGLFIDSECARQRHVHLNKEHMHMYVRPMCFFNLLIFLILLTHIFQKLILLNFKK